MNLTGIAGRGGSLRRGITILEVLIAAGVLAIGMLGVMAMIPLIAMRLREGEIADRSAILSRNAVEELQVRGWTDPYRWRWYLADGTYVVPTGSGSFTPPQRTAICIDPLGMASMTGGTTVRSFFPYNGDATVTLHRVTPFDLVGYATPDDEPGYSINRAIAETALESEDDLLFERPESRMDLPTQTFPTSAGELQTSGVAAADYPQHQTRRMAQRDYSYLATLVPLDVPTTTVAPAFSDNGNYLMSVAVFAQRGRDYANQEHVGFINPATGGFQSSGISGGDVVIDCSLDTEMLNLAKGDWVMLSTPQQTVTVSGVTRYIPSYHRWYQIIEAVPYVAGTTREVTLAGSDWPYASAAGFPSPWPVVSTQVTWLPGVASVSEKTITLGSDGTWQ
ncbi:MAG TPA: hypothetical protein VGN57_18080 [Pirellulaceae bacterium]|jgi:hypothetical protein|nr:hypothetical protein [Pirellulaceae bacterium]